MLARNQFDPPNVEIGEGSIATFLDRPEKPGVSPLRALVRRSILPDGDRFNKYPAHHLSQDPCWSIHSNKKVDCNPILFYLSHKNHHQKAMGCRKPDCHTVHAQLAPQLTCPTTSVLNSTMPDHSPYWFEQPEMNLLSPGERKQSS